MTRFRLILALVLLSLAPALSALAQMEAGWQVTPLTEDGTVEYDFNNHSATATNGVLVRFGPAVLTANQVAVNFETGVVEASGGVRIQRDDLLWVSEHVIYNFKNRQLEAQQFRSGRSPIFVAGDGLHGQFTNRFYAATNAVITTDDVQDPSVRIRARSIKILPGDKLQARDAVLYVENVPVFYFPYYARRLGDRVNRFNLLPGYRSTFGAFLMVGYEYYLTDELDGELHLDYRSRRGVGVGPDVNFDYGRWGQGSFKYYYLHDQEPDADAEHGNLPHNRQRVWLSYQAHPYTNFSVRSMVRYQGDTNIVREFFEGEYRDNPHPSTFVEINRFWRNFSLDIYAQPRLNDFLETVERLPDVKLTGYRQQLGSSPLYYESESSVAYLRRLFAETNSVRTDADFAAGRADTYHQVTLPHTFFNWLNVSPRVGGRFTYYTDSSGPGGTWDNESRGIFNTGVEVSAKASRTWTDARSEFFDLDGLRHIVTPSVNYVFVPRPSVRPPDLPQFDYEFSSLRLLPIEFPDYNSIDSIDSQNVLRLGLRNKLQSKRDGAVENVLSWDLYTDWRLDPRDDQTRFADVYSDLVLRPRSWLSLESINRFDPDSGRLRMAVPGLTIHPNNVWHWNLSYFYLRDDIRPWDPTALGEGNDLFSSTFFYRLDDNWGFRIAHKYDLRDQLLREQAYTLYRDLRSWTAGLTFRIRRDVGEEDDFTVAFTFSVKAFPRSSSGRESSRPQTLWGG